MPDVERVIRQGEQDARRLQGQRSAEQTQAEQQTARKASRLQPFEALDERNGVLGERAERMLEHYKGLQEHGIGRYAFVVLDDTAEDDTAMWAMGVVARRSEYRPGTRYTLGTFATDSSAVVESAQAGELYGNGSWQYGLEEQYTYKIADPQNEIDEDLLTRHMTHIPTIGLRFTAETRAFAPVRAVQRAYWAAAIDRRLSGLEGTMDLFEGAAADFQLNPGLARALETQAA